MKELRDKEIKGLLRECDNALDKYSDTQLEMIRDYAKLINMVTYDDKVKSFSDYKEIVGEDNGLSKLELKICTRETVTLGNKELNLIDFIYLVNLMKISKYKKKEFLDMVKEMPREFINSVKGVLITHNIK